MTRTQLAAFVFVGCTITNPCPADAADDITPRDAFQLSNDCRPVNVMVNEVDSTVADMGITVSGLTAVAADQLDAIGLYDGDAVETLIVTLRAMNVPELVGGPFFAKVVFYKVMTDERTGVKLHAAAWEQLNYGAYAHRDFILNTLVDQLDTFILEYLRVNAQECN